MRKLSWLTETLYFCLSGLSHDASTGCHQWSRSFSWLRELHHSRKEASCNWFHNAHIIFIIDGLLLLLQLKSELEMSSQQQSRLNEVIRAVTQVRRATYQFSVVILLDGNVAVWCRAGHYSLGCHRSTVQQRLLAGSSVFGPYVQQLQSQFRWVWTPSQNSKVSITFVTIVSAFSQFLRTSAIYQKKVSSDQLRPSSQRLEKKVSIQEWHLPPMFKGHAFTSGHSFECRSRLCPPGAG